MRNLVFLLVLFLALPACKGGDNTAKNNMKKKEVELILQTRKSADISAVCLAHNDVGLKSKKVLSARMGTWLDIVRLTSHLQIRFADIKEWYDGQAQMPLSTITPDFTEDSPTQLPYG